ncbi:hypothetical protein J4437_04585 [Candidatus Woesearchaeota archaeon]|nr:hypothetical protein [Candidatus Woesearchaeota archaeon]
MATFKKNDDLYRAVSSQFPYKNKVRLYASTDGKRHLKIVNDLKSSNTGWGTFWNTVVQINHVGALGSLPSLSDPFCVNGEPTPQTIDPGYWAMYDFPETHNKGSYKFSVSIGAYVPNLLTLTDSCSTTPIEGLISDMNYDEFGVEVFDSSGVTLDCATYSQPQCDLWRVDQLQMDCAMNNIYKGFDHIVLDHCEGMTYEIRLSGLLPDKTRMTAEPPLCNVYAEAAR